MRSSPSQVISSAIIIVVLIYCLENKNSVVNTIDLEDSTNTISIIASFSRSYFLQYIFL